jgi:hypothetical protein
MSVRGQTSKGEPITISAELVAVREEAGGGLRPEDRFSVTPADILIDLPAHPSPSDAVWPLDLGPAIDFLKTTIQMERRAACQEERKHYAQVCRDYLEKSFDARTRAAQDRVFVLRAREANSPEVGLARQRSEQDLADLQRTRQDRLAGLDRLTIARHGPVRHISTALVLPSTMSAAAQINALLEDIDPEIRRRSELAAEDVVLAFEHARKWECEKVGHLKIGFDIRSLGPANPQTGYRDPVHGVRRIEVKGRKRGQVIRLTTNEWYKAQQLGDSYWLYVIWDPLNNPDPNPLIIQNPAKHLDHAKREVIAARYFDLPADAIEIVAKSQRKQS